MKISVITPTIRPEGLEIVKECLRNQEFDHFEWLVEVGLGKKHDLNSAYNKMLRRAKGRLIVFYQDFIKCDNQALKRFWEAYRANPRVFYTAPVGKSKSKDYTGEIKWDWRNSPEATMQGYRSWEIDFGSAPKSALFEIGGFDEYLDEYWSCDNLDTGLRAEMAGYTFGNLIDNKAIAFDHDAFIEHPFRKNYNTKHYDERAQDIRMGVVKVDYLN